MKLSFGVLGAKISTRITKVDGGTVSHAPNADKREYWIKPGKRSIEAKCSIDMGKHKASGKGKIEMTLEQGQTYALTATTVMQLGKKNNDDLRCEPVIEIKQD